MKVKGKNKLVRDQIPDIMKKQGLTPKIYIASEEEYSQRLNEKLKEEIKEYLESEDQEELADILEVIYAICELKGFDKKEVEKLRLNKQKERGGFKKRIILKKN